MVIKVADRSEGLPCARLRSHWPKGPAMQAEIKGCELEIRSWTLCFFGWTLNNENVKKSSERNSGFLLPPGRFFFSTHLHSRVKLTPRGVFSDPLSGRGFFRPLEKGSFSVS